jgi:manganese oxidase
MTNPISMRARVGIGVLLAYGGTAWLHVLNAAGATAEARTWGGSALSFLRDGTLSLLLVLSAVLFALAMTNRLRPATRVTSVPRATVAAVGVTAVMFMSGAIGHAVVLSSEHVPTAQVAAGDTASTVVRVGANPLGAAPVAKVPTGTKPGYQPHQASSPAMTASMGLTPTPADPTNPHAAHNGAAPGTADDGHTTHTPGCFRSDAGRGHGQP